MRLAHRHREIRRRSPVLAAFAHATVSGACRMSRDLGVDARDDGSGVPAGATKPIHALRSRCVSPCSPRSARGKAHRAPSRTRFQQDGLGAARTRPRAEHTISPRSPWATAAMAALGPLYGTCTMSTGRRVEELHVDVIAHRRPRRLRRVVVGQQPDKDVSIDRDHGALSRLARRRAAFRRSSARRPDIRRCRSHPRDASPAPAEAAADEA